MSPPGRGHFGPQGRYLNKLGRDLLGDATYQISRLIGLVVKVLKIYIRPCDLDIPFDQLFERAISGSFLSAKFDKIQTIILGGDIFEAIVDDTRRTSNDHNSSLRANDTGELITYTKYCNFGYVYLTLTLYI